MYILMLDAALIDLRWHDFCQVTWCAPLRTSILSNYPYVYKQDVFKTISNYNRLP